MYQISFGRVDVASQDRLLIVTGSALKVIHTEQQDLSQSDLLFVPYPCGNFPLELVDKDWYWSFSVLSNKEFKFYNNNVDFSQATIEVTLSTSSSISDCANVEKTRSGSIWQRDIESMPISNVSFNNVGYGLPNHLQWKVANVEIGQAYHVAINNVLVDNQLEEYEYYVSFNSSANDSNSNDSSGDSGGGSSGGGGCFISIISEFK